MAITDLLDRVSFSPAFRGDGAPSASETPREGLGPTIEIELPSVEQVGGLDPVALPPAFAPVVEVIGANNSVPPRSDPATEAASGQEIPTHFVSVDSARADDDPAAQGASGLGTTASNLGEEGPSARSASPPPSSPSRRSQSLPPLPSWGIAVIGGLALLCLALGTVLVVAVAEPATVEAIPVTADTPPAPASQAETPTDPAAQETPPEPAVSPASFPAEPTAIPVELLTRLEEASDEALDVELARLLEAMQFGFGRRSAQLEPTLRSYVYRMGSRFEWNPDTFRVAVTAPDPALATARAALLERLFEDAVAAGRLDVGTGVGPHALTLVTE